MGAVIKTSGLVGLLTGAVALGVAELTAAVTGPNGAPVVAVGETAINLTPVPVKEFAIAHFGTHDKEALLTGIVVLLAAFAAGIGVLAVRRLAYGLAALAVFAAVGVAAAVSLPTATGSDVVPTLVGAAVAAVTLVLLVRTAGGVGRQETAGLAGQPAGGAGTDRRRFLIVGVGAAALGVAAGGLGNALLGRFSIASSRAQVRLPGPAVPAAAVPAGADFRIPGQQARLAAADGIDTWGQWMWAWDARPGLHQLQVRATDNSGVTQTPRRVQPVPNGASGWDSVAVTVT